MLEEQLNKKLQMLVSDGLLGDKKMYAWDELMERSSQAFATGSQAFNGMLDPKVSALLSSDHRSVAATEDSREDGSGVHDDDNDDEEEEEGGPGGAPKPVPEKKVDMEVVRNKNERRFLSVVEGVEKTLAATNEQINAELLRSSEQEFVSERKAVVKRQQWLQCVLEHEEPELSKMKAMANWPSGAAGAEEKSESGSRDLTAVANSGPNQFEGLETLHTFRARNTISTCATEEDVKSVFDELSTPRKAYGCLNTSCRRVLQDSF